MTVDARNPIQGREVSCRVLAVFFDELRDRALPPAYLVEGTDLDVEALTDRNRRISWDTFRRVMENAGQIWSNDQLAEIAGRFPLHPLARPIAVAARAFVEPADLYRWIVSPKNGPARHLLHCVRFEMREIAPLEHEFVLRMDPGYEPCPEYASAVRGAMAATPGLLGLPDAEVELERTGEEFRYRVRTSQRGGLFARFRRSVRWLLESRAVAAELREAYHSLQANHQLLLEETAERTRAQGELHQREAELGSLVSHAPVVLFALDRDGVFVLSEGRGLEVLGLRPGEVVGRSVFEMYADHPKIVEDCRRALRGETFETRTRLGELTFEIRYSPRTIEDGEVNGTIGVATDVTERLRAERALRERESQLHWVINHAPVAVFALNREGTVTLSEGSALRHLGLEPGERVGKNVFDYHHDHPTIPADTRRALQGEDFRTTASVDGVTIETWFTPHFDEDGNLDGTVGVALDVTERLRAQEALREREALLRNAFDNFPFGFWALDAELRCTMQNTAARGIWGDAVGRRPAELELPVEPAQALAENARRALGGEVATWRFERSVDGEVRSFAAIAGPLRIEGDIRGVVGVFQDETERLALETEVRRRDRMRALGSLAGGIAHDFNHVLTAVLGNAQLAESKLPDTHDARRNLAEIRTAGARARALVDQIVAFSRSDARGRKPIAIQDTVRDAVKFLRATFPRSIEIRERLDAPDAVVDANATQIYQVVLNLGSNAQHAIGPTAGTVEISLEEVEVDEALASAVPDLAPGPHLKLGIGDTGSGIADEILKRVFDPFFSTKENGEGCGLGLSVVRGIVREHHGAIRLRSAPGAGTTVEVFLRRIPTPVPGAPPPRVLFVDDDATSASYVRQLLEGFGCEARTSLSGEDALERLRSDPSAFDLVITDQNMARMSGTGLAEHVRRIRPELPVILCTGYVDDFTRDFAREHGFRAYLPKPVEPEELMQSVHDALRGAPPEGN